MEPLNPNLLTQTLNFHGQQMQKLWESERGEQDLVKNSIRDLNYDVYNKRNKHLSFQDRGKRLKLQQFIVRKANVIFSPENTAEKNKPPTEESVITEDMYAIMPPLETYLTADKQARLKYFFENVKIGDLILGTIMSKTQSGMMLKVLCTTGIGATVYYVHDINAFCPVANIIPAVDRKGVSRSYMMNDSVCCEVLEVIPDTDKMVCGMKGTTREPNDPPHRPALGLVSADDFPLVYKKALDHKNDNYESVLEKSVGFNNPNNISYLASQMGIDTHQSLMDGLRGRFPEPEYASELRQQQASKWAYSNVADGIDHFKAGRHTEAFQCLNKALNIDPKNVEGLVARGALFANSGNFQKAIEDFETALKLNPNHANARKYMGETLVALGRSYEEENKIEDARKAYQSCLAIIPFHEEAQNSLEFLKSKSQTKNLIEPNELLLPNLAAGGVSKQPDVHDTLKQLLKGEEEEKKDKKKKKKSKKKKNRRRSSSTSSSSSSGSNESSSSSSSSSSDSSSTSGGSDFKKHKKRRSQSHRREKQSSLSPLSKRMALMDPSHEAPMNYQFNKPAASNSFDFSFEQPEQPKAPPEPDDYEHKVRAFLDQTKGDSDYEDKVRKFLEESTKWKKEKRGEEKKKKKKKDRKSKKENKKKRKKEKRRKQFDLSEYELRDALKKELGIKDKEKKSKKHGLNSDDEEYLLHKVTASKKFLESLPDLEELESKLSAYYALEKESKRSELSDSPKRLMDSPSPTREQKARQAVAEASAASGVPKWKMQIGQATAGSSRFKKKPEREDWHDDSEKQQRLSKNGELDMGGSSKKIAPVPPPMSDEKMGGLRKPMSMKDTVSKKTESELLKKLRPAPPGPPKPVIPPGQVVLDKFGNFRLMTPPKEMSRGSEPDLPPLPAGAPPKGSFAGRKPPEPPGRPRSMSKSRSRSRSKPRYTRSRSSSQSRSRSRSYRSRSRSYYSRSRSRSGSYYSRSRSRSRSYSGERRRYNRPRGGFRGRYNDRGTYYKPRFQNPRQNYQRGGRGNYRDYRNDRDYRGGRGGGRPYYNPRGGRRPRGGRFRGGGGYRDYRDRRYDRSRSRDRSRSFSGSRDRDSVEPPKKIHDADKDKINKYADGDGEPIRHEGPLSEGEDRDDYTTEKFVDREAYDGKWAEKDDSGRGDGDDGRDDGGKDIPSETNIEEMDKFLTKVKKDKKEEMMERNKDFLKNKE
ncbi:tetratricopeptide repeat protein 14 homolog isoform X2 [Onthophagus taurus]|uniref:tetratricopeptide repeat protein 14 homolog isoform X2 n=1 Tax=Onthophagus taurus TaxID=166361 RepID=UPI000C201C7E|nr:tetratricopeptide repeat protein 14 isoform X2 [Onthophagus taurus]